MISKLLLEFIIMKFVVCWTYYFICYQIVIRSPINVKSYLLEVLHQLEIRPI